MLLLGLLNCFCLSFMSHMHVMFMKSLQWLCTCNIYSIFSISVTAIEQARPLVQAVTYRDPVLAVT